MGRSVKGCNRDLLVSFDLDERFIVCLLPRILFKNEPASFIHPILIRRVRTLVVVVHVCMTCLFRVGCCGRAGYCYCIAAIGSYFLVFRYFCFYFTRNCGRGRRRHRCRRAFLSPWYIRLIAPATAVRFFRGMVAVFFFLCYAGRQAAKPT